MNKKTLTALLAFASALCLCLGIAACAPDGSDEHTHHFEYVYNNDATCTEDGTETERCECGARGETRVKEGSKLGHDMVQLAAQTATCSECGYPAHIGCSRCGYTEEDITYTDALHVHYTLLEGHYSVTGLNGECTDSEIKIPSAYKGHPVTNIGSSAFFGCESLESITIPNSVTDIGSSAFSGCESLESITIPNSVTSIANEAFQGCSSLQNIIIPESVTEIGMWAFGACTSLQNIIIPESVTEIGYDTFFGCSSLTSIIIPNSVTLIGASAFAYCSSLESITIPASVTEIGRGAFERTAFYENDANWINDILYVGDYLIRARDTISGACNIREGTKLIADGAFQGCSSLTSITIPNSVIKIGLYAFYRCGSLTSIIIPNSVTSIGSNVFNRVRDTAKNQNNLLKRSLSRA